MHLASPILISELKVSSNLEIASMFFCSTIQSLLGQIERLESQFCPQPREGVLRCLLGNQRTRFCYIDSSFEYATHPMLAMKSLASISELLTFSTSSLSCFSTSSVDIFEVLIPCSMTKASLSSLPLCPCPSVSGLLQQMGLQAEGQGYQPGVLAPRHWCLRHGLDGLVQLSHLLEAQRVVHQAAGLPVLFPSGKSTKESSTSCPGVQQEAGSFFHEAAADLPEVDAPVVDEELPLALPRRCDPVNYVLQRAEDDIPELLALLVLVLLEQQDPSDVQRPNFPLVLDRDPLK